MILAEIDRTNAWLKKKRDSVPHNYFITSCMLRKFEAKLRCMIAKGEAPSRKEGLECVFSFAFTYRFAVF